MSKKILHIGVDCSIVRSFIDFVKDEFEFKNHTFLLTTDNYKKINCPNVKLSQRTLAARLKHYVYSIIKINQSDKVVLHGIFDIKLVFILFLMPWALKKCYWVIWGGDLYDFKIANRNWNWRIRELFRRPVIKKIGQLITYIPGDAQLARHWYGAIGQHHTSLMYLSNVITHNNIQLGNKKTVVHPIINVLIGNSSDSSNNHLESLQKLLPYKNDKIKIFVPLSYGDEQHAKKVIEKGKDWFGENFVPITTFMAFNDYMEFLKTMDIAIFNHKRQQAMGNTITLLGMGKTVYMRSGVSHYDFLHGLGLNLKDIADFRMEKISNEEANNNKIIVSEYFSVENLKKQLALIFEE